MCLFFLSILISHFPFNFTDSIPARFHTFSETLLWNSSPIMPRPRRNLNEFVETPVAYAGLSPRKAGYLRE
jgi:hypothetical protein